jgi:predicted amidophosphoribosyltransferase
MGVAIFFPLALLAAAAIVYPLLPGRAPAALAPVVTDGEIEAAVRKLRRARAAGSGRACPACGEAYQPGDRFCVRCGGPLPQGEQVKSPLPQTGPVCPSCGAALQEGDRFCAKCGYTLRDEEVV